MPPRVIGGLAGFGAEALIAAIAFYLTPESAVVSLPQSTLWLLIGATGERAAAFAAGVLLAMLTDSLMAYAIRSRRILGGRVDRRWVRGIDVLGMNGRSRTSSGLRSSPSEPQRS